MKEYTVSTMKKLAAIILDYKWRGGVGYFFAPPASTIQRALCDVQHGYIRPSTYFLKPWLTTVARVLIRQVRKITSRLGQSQGKTGRSVRNTMGLFVKIIHIV